MQRLLRVLLSIIRSLFSKREPVMTQDQVQLFIRRIDNTWRIVDEGGNMVTPVVRRGSTITWTAKEANAFFQFPDVRLFEELLERKTWTAEIPAGTARTFTVSREAPQGTYVYAAFNAVQEGDACRDLGYAEGGSPPTFRIAE